VIYSLIDGYVTDDNIFIFQFVLCFNKHNNKKTVTILTNKLRTNRSIEDDTKQISTAVENTVLNSHLCTLQHTAQQCT